MIYFVYKTDRIKVSTILKQCKDLTDFISNNRYLNDDKNKDNNNIQGATSSPRTHNQQTFSFLPQEEQKHNDTDLSAVNTTNQQMLRTTHQTLGERFESNEGRMKASGVKNNITGIISNRKNGMLRDLDEEKKELDIK